MYSAACAVVELCDEANWRFPMRLSGCIRRLEDTCLRWWRRARRRPERSPKGFPVEDTEERIRKLRARGVRIGEHCVVHTSEFSTEPYLVELGDRVVVAGGTMFFTHEGTARIIRDERPSAQLFGKIVVGDDTLIGQNCIIHPGAEIGRRCVIGSGTVIRGKIPDNSLVVGNPGRVVGRASLLRGIWRRNRNTLDTLHLSSAEREFLIRKHFDLPDSSR